jgi:hypothetical protein
MTYRLRRPEDRAGRGNLTVYRAISTDDQPLLQRPMGWVRLQRAYQALAADSNPAIAAALAAASVPHIEKVWTELAYESVRLAVAPTLPSRLDSLFAFADPLEALSFTEIAGEAKHVWEMAVPAETSWAVVDMTAFASVDPATKNASGYEAAWEEALERGRSYWTPCSTIKVAEVLVAGPATLTRRLELLPLLRDLGLIEA